MIAARRFNREADVRLAGLDTKKQFILNEEFAEFGAMNVGGFGTMMLGPTLIVHGTEEQKAEYLVRAFRFAREHWSPWIGPMTVISIADPEWTAEDEQYWWAITYPDFPETRVRPAYDALRAMPK